MNEGEGVGEGGGGGKNGGSRICKDGERGKRRGEGKRLKWEIEKEWKNRGV